MIIKSRVRSNMLIENKFFILMSAIFCAMLSCLISGFFLQWLSCLCCSPCVRDKDFFWFDNRYFSSVKIL